MNKRLIKLNVGTKMQSDRNFQYCQAAFCRTLHFHQTCYITIPLHTIILRNVRVTFCKHKKIEAFYKIYH